MKKLIIVFILLLCLPLTINAASCNKDKFKENMEIAEGITYNNDYSKSKKNWTITFYGISNNFYLKYKEKTYKPTDHSVIISSVPQGEKVTVEVLGDDNCGVLNYFFIEEKYLNEFYGSSMCEGYEEKLTACSSEFTKSRITKEYLEKVINNYNNAIITEDDTKKEETKETINTFQKIKEFLLNWGIKILLLVVTTAVSITFYDSKFRKIKHHI